LRAIFAPEQRENDIVTNCSNSSIYIASNPFYHRVRVLNKRKLKRILRSSIHSG